MKKTVAMLLSLLMVSGLAACGGKKQEDAQEGFKPSLDTFVSGHINIYTAAMIILRRWRRNLTVLTSSIPMWK